MCKYNDARKNHWVYFSDLCIPDAFEDADEQGEGDASAPLGIICVWKLAESLVAIIIKLTGKSRGVLACGRKSLRAAQLSRKKSLS